MNAKPAPAVARLSTSTSKRLASKPRVPKITKPATNDVRQLAMQMTSKTMFWSKKQIICTYPKSHILECSHNRHPLTLWNLLKLARMGKAAMPAPREKRICPVASVQTSLQLRGGIELDLHCR